MDALVAQYPFGENMAEIASLRERLDGLPAAPDTERVVADLAEAEALDDVAVFHAGTRHDQNRWLTNGGRVLGVTARGSTISEARESAYQAIRAIDFDGAHYRTDIGWRALDRERRQS